MRTADELNELARQMRQAQDEGCQIAPFSSRIEDFDLPTAYAVADLMHRERVSQGAVPVGRKIGFTNREMWPIYGVHEPIWGYVYDTTAVHVTGNRASCSIGRLSEPKIEPEIVLHFHSAPLAGADLPAILACIDWIALGFEIVRSHFPKWKFSAADTVVDGGLHGKLLIGEPQPVDRLGPDPVSSLEHFILELHGNGILRAVGSGANILGNPLQAIAHLTAALERQPDYPALQAGELVTTGTVTTAQAVHIGESWRADVDGIALPRLSVEFHE